MLKKLSVLLSLTLVVTLLSLNGCSKSDAPTSPGTTDVQNQSAPTGQFDPDFPSTYADAVVQPTIPTMDQRNGFTFIGFIVKFLGLDPTADATTITDLKNAFTNYDACLKQIRTDLKAGTYNDPVTGKIDRTAVMAAIKACYTDFQAALDAIKATLTADQQKKWDILFHRLPGGRGPGPGGKGPGGIAANGLVDVMDVIVNHNDVTIADYENEVTESASPSVIMDPLAPRGFLGFLVRALKLTDVQIAAIKSYMTDTYNPALKDAFTKLQTANKDAMTAFKAAMTAATTDAERQAAKTALQAALKAAAQAARASVKAAHDSWIAFMTGTGTDSAGLTADQIALFKKIFRIK
jgi:hypothetical protein